MITTPSKVLIAASLLSADFSKLGEAVTDMDKADVDMFHIDVMDGQFVPNITIGPAVIKSLRSYSIKPFVVHMMVKEPEHLIAAIAEAGADYIIVHVEACAHLPRVLQLIKQCGKKAGVAINPETQHDALEYIYPYVDVVIVMTINPGFGGQELMISQIPKIKSIREQTDRICHESGHRIHITIDGGVNAQNARQLMQAGADILAAGTAVFSGGPKSYANNIKSLRVI